MKKWRSKSKRVKGGKLVELLRLSATTTDTLDTDSILEVKNACRELAQCSDKQFVSNYKKLICAFKEGQNLSRARKKKEVESPKLSEDESEEGDNTYCPHEDIEEDTDEDTRSLKYDEDESPAKMTRKVTSKKKPNTVAIVDRTRSFKTTSSPMRVQHPTIVSVFGSADGHQNVSVVIIPFSGTVKDQYTVKVANDGLSIDIIYHVSPFFLNPDWMIHIDKHYNSYSCRYQGYWTAVVELTNHRPFGPVYAVQTIQLPFEVERKIAHEELMTFTKGEDQSQFLQLYQVDLKSIQISYGENNQKFNVYHLSDLAKVPGMSP